MCLSIYKYMCLSIYKYMCLSIYNYMYIYQGVWTVYTHSVNNLSCAQHLLCQINHNERKNNVDSRYRCIDRNS